MSRKTKGIVTAGHSDTAEAAVRALELGGNAYDAAIAAMFVTFVAEPCMSSLGGGGFMTAVSGSGEPALLDFFAHTPRRKRPAKELDFFPIEIDFGTATEIFHVGVGSMATPGSLAGAYEIHRRWGSLPFTELLAPAIEFARYGSLIDDFQALDIRLLSSILEATEAGQPIFYPNGKRVVAGDHILMPGFADFLETLGKEGEDLFYRGEIAQMIVKECEEKGGHLTMADMENYQVIARKPGRISYRGHTVYSNPLPSIGGTLLEMGLTALEKQNINYAPTSREHLATLAAILRDMDERHHAPDFIAGAQEYAGKMGSTTHFNVMDEQGNAVAITSSNGEGCAYMVPGTDIMMNNMLGEAALLPQGFHTWPENIRLTSMMAPTIVVDKTGKPEVATGSAGAGRIPGAILQVLHRILDLGMDCESAVNGPRVHWRGGTLNVEGAYPHEGLNMPGLKEVVHWKEPNMYFGGTNTAMKRKGHWAAAGDARRSGVVRTVE